MGMRGPEPRCQCWVCAGKTGLTMSRAALCRAPSAFCQARPHRKSFTRVSKSPAQYQKWGRLGTRMAPYIGNKFTEQDSDKLVSGAIEQGGSNMPRPKRPCQPPAAATTVLSEARFTPPMPHDTCLAFCRNSLRNEQTQTTVTPRRSLTRCGSTSRRSACGSCAMVARAVGAPTAGRTCWPAAAEPEAQGADAFKS